MMKKQFLAGIMSFTLAASMLAGCGKDTEIKESASGRSKEFESVDNSESSSETSSETAAENASIEDNIYEAFMNGDVKVKYQNLPSKGGDALSDHLEHDEALTGGHVVYVSLEDRGLRVVVDKGEKVNGAYEFDTYDVVMKLG